MERAPHASSQACTSKQDVTELFSKQESNKLFLTGQGKFGTVRRVRTFGWVTMVPSFSMITIKGKEHRTIQDAAEEFGVSTKAVHSWIKKGIISKPPQVEYGV